MIQLVIYNLMCYTIWVLVKQGEICCVQYYDINIHSGDGHVDIQLWHTLQFNKNFKKLVIFLEAFLLLKQMWKMLFE